MTFALTNGHKHKSVSSLVCCIISLKAFSGQEERRRKKVRILLTHTQGIFKWI